MPVFHKKTVHKTEILGHPVNTKSRKTNQLHDCISILAFLCHKIDNNRKQTASRFSHVPGFGFSPRQR